MKKQKKVKKTKIKYLIVFVILLISIIVLIKNNKTNFKLAKKSENNQEISIQLKEKNPNNYTYVMSKDGIQVPVPRGYTASSVEEEQYVNVQKDEQGNTLYQGGFVIYEGTEAVPQDSDGLFTAQKTRNQWVWVPISSEQFNEIYHMSGNEYYSNQYNFPSATSEDDQTSKENITIARTIYFYE